MMHILAYILFLTLLVTPAFGEHHPINTLDELRWKNRILLIFVNENADIEHLYETFQKHNDEIDDRDIRFFIIGGSVETHDERTLAHDYQVHLKERYKIHNNAMTVVLIGKDGGEKYRKNSLDLEEIYRVIDAMPMRIQEMKRRF
jgi:hypothetical protein